MRILKFLMIAPICALLFLNSCTKEQVADELEDRGVLAVMSDSDATRAISDACGEPLMTDFLAGQHNDAGDISIYNDAETLFVCAEIHDGWTMTQSHLYVGEDVPKKFAPGKFGNKTDHGDGVSSFCYEFALADLPECYVIAFHAEVEGTDGSGNSAETAWAAGTASGKNWSMYNEYCTEECDTSCEYDSGAGQIPSTCGGTIGGFDQAATSVSFVVTYDAGIVEGTGSSFFANDYGVTFGSGVITFTLTNADGCTDTITFDILGC